MLLPFSLATTLAPSLSPVLKLASIFFIQIHFSTLTFIFYSAMAALLIQSIQTEFPQPMCPVLASTSKSILTPPHPTLKSSIQCRTVPSHLGASHPICTRVVPGPCAAPNSIQLTVDNSTPWWPNVSPPRSSPWFHSAHPFGAKPRLLLSPNQHESERDKLRPPNYLIPGPGKR